MWPFKKTPGKIETTPDGGVTLVGDVTDSDVRAELNAKLVLIKEIETELKRLKKVAADEIEKPLAPYRIVKIEVADNSCGQSGYFVQAWRVRQFGWELTGRTEFGHWNYWYPDQNLELRQAARALSWGAVPLKHTYIVWENIGSANPHATYEAAAEWLRKWLRPECEEVLMDASGNPVQAARTTKTDGESA